MADVPVPTPAKQTARPAAPVAQGAAPPPAAPARPAAAAVQPAAPAAAAQPAAAPTPHRSQKLREVQIRRVKVDDFQHFGQFLEPRHLRVPADWDLEDLLNPDAWTFVASRLQGTGADCFKDGIGTILEVRPTDHAFFAALYLRGLRRNPQGQADGAYVTCIGPTQDEDGKACPIDLKTGMPWKGRPKPAAAEAA